MDLGYGIQNTFLKGFILILVFTITMDKAYCQRPTSQTVSRIIENILEEKDQALDYSDLVTSLNHYYENPLSLNKASKDELLSLPFLNVPQVNGIIAYRDQYDGFTTVYELQAVSSLDRKTIKWLLPFVNTRKEKDRIAINLKNLTQFGNHDIFLRGERLLEKVKGQRIADTASSRENNKGYLGSPLDLYTRYQYTLSDRISLGFTAEKDAGEEFFQGSQSQGFDYYSGHLFMKDIGPLKSLALGDFEAQFGQGLVMASGLSLGKTPNAFGLSKGNEGLDAYTSANENNYFRGIGATWGLKNTKVTGFYSNKLQDANLATQDTLRESRAITSIKSSGMHRRKAELADKNAFRQELAGAHISQDFANLDIGLTGLYVKNEKPLSISDKLYDQFDWSGKEAWNLGLDYKWLYRNFYFFGEFGYSHSGAVANLNGMLINFPSGIKLGALYRHYPRNYNAPYGNAFRESGQVSNENGLFLTLQTELFENWQVSTYFDYFKFPWLRFRTDQPSEGREYQTNITYDPGGFEMYWRIKGQSKVRNLSESEASVGKTGRYQQWYFRWNLDYKISRNWSFQTRLVHSFYQMEDQSPIRGWLAFQDVRYEVADNDFYVIGRYALFNVDDYQARIYTYENDLLYTFSIPFFQDRGMRYYLLSKLKAWGKLSLWIKAGRTHYFNKNTVGSGYQAINGNTKTTVKTQVRLQF